MRRFIALALLLVFSMSMLVACGQPAAQPAAPAKPAAPEPIKVGYLSHVTGDGAVWGVPEVNGAKLAAEEINKAGGVLGRPLEIVTIDGRGNAADSVNAVKKALTENKIVALLGSNYSGVNIATSAIVTEAKVPQIGSYSTNPKVTLDEAGKVKPYMFRLCFIDPYQGQIVANLAFNEFKKKNAAILYDIGSDYSVGLMEFFVKTFTELGGTVVGKWAFKEGDVDFRPQLSQIKAKKPDVILLPNLYKEIALAAKQARELGMNDVMFVGGDGASVKMLEMAGKELQNSYWCTHMSWEDPKVADVRKKYAAKYGDNEEFNLVMGYDLVYFLADAIKRAGKAEGPAIRDAIETAKGVQLAHATITMDPATHNPLNKEAVIQTPKEGKLVFYKRYAPTK